MGVCEMVHISHCAANIVIVGLFFLVIGSEVQYNHRVLDADKCSFLHRCRCKLAIRSC